MWKFIQLSPFCEPWRLFPVFHSPKWDSKKLVFVHISSWATILDSVPGPGAQKRNRRGPLLWGTVHRTCLCEFVTDILQYTAFFFRQLTTFPFTRYWFRAVSTRQETEVSFHSEAHRSVWTLQPVRKPAHGGRWGGWRAALGRERCLRLWASGAH